MYYLSKVKLHLVKLFSETMSVTSYSPVLSLMMGSLRESDLLSGSLSGVKFCMVWNSP